MSNLTIALVPYYVSYDSETDRPYCLKYSNSSGELAVTRFTYDKKGLNTLGFYQQITGNRSSKNTHEFDKERRMVRKLRKYNDGEASIEKFIYDKNGALEAETFENSKGQTGAATYEYDAAGNAIKMVCNGYKGWLEGVLVFELLDDGRRKDGTLLQGGEQAGSISYNYDRSGNLVQEEWTIGSWKQSLWYVYEPVN